MKEIEIEAGHTISADWYEEDVNNIVLLLKGFESTRTKQVPMVKSIIDKTGYSVLVPEYSGHGESPLRLEDMTPAEQLFEVVRAYDWIKQNYPEANIHILGCSYGGYLATLLLSYRTLDKVVLRVPAIYRPQDFYTTWERHLHDPDYYEEHTREYRENPEALKINPAFEIGKLYKDNTLVVIHEFDEVIPRVVTDTYRDTFSAQEYLAKGFKHSVGDTQPTEEQLEEYTDAIADFLR